MASFLAQLTDLLDDARRRDVLDDAVRERLLGLAAERERAAPKRHRLTVAVSGLGAVGLLLGIILLIAANWRAIPNAVKLGGFFVLFLGAHGAGIALRRPRTHWPALADAFSLLGAGLFLGGLGLVSQIYNIHENPAHGVLAWLVASAAMAVALASTPLAAMALVAGLIWGPMALVQARYGNTGALMFAFFGAWPFLLFALSFGADRLRASMGRLFRTVGVVFITGSVFLLGFFRHFGREIGRYHNAQSADTVTVAALLAGIVVVAGAALFWSLGLRDGRRSRGDAAGLALTVVTVCTVLGAIGLALGVLDTGTATTHAEFGRHRTGYAGPWFVSVGAWVAWFGWSLWLVFEGGARDRSGWITLGVYGVVAGLVVRYFDLIGTLAATGAAFVMGGIVLLLAGWSAEKWRRNLLREQTPPPGP